MSDVIVDGGTNHGVTGAFTAFTTETYCGLTFRIGEALHKSSTVTCPECLRIMAELGIVTNEPQRKPLTINGLVDMAYGTAKANGFHDQDHMPVTTGDAYGQVAGLGMILVSWAPVVEAVRKGENPFGGISDMYAKANVLRRFGPSEAAEVLTGALSLEPWQLRQLAWLALEVTELVEAMEAVIKRDKDNFIEELADTAIRIGDSIGAINSDPTHPFYGIDLEAAILAKNERNKARGYRHGGKRA